MTSWDHGTNKRNNQPNREANERTNEPTNHTMERTNEPTSHRNHGTTEEPADAIMERTRKLRY